MVPIATLDCIIKQAGRCQLKRRCLETLLCVEEAGCALPCRTVFAEARQPIVWVSTALIIRFGRLELILKIVWQLGQRDVLPCKE